MREMEEWTLNKYRKSVLKTSVFKPESCDIVEKAAKDVNKRRTETFLLIIFVCAPISSEMTKINGLFTDNKIENR